MPDISSHVSQVNFKGYPRVKVGKECQSFALDNHVWRILDNNSDWVKVDTTNLAISGFDERLMYISAKDMTNASAPYTLHKFNNDSGPVYTMLTDAEPLLNTTKRLESYMTTILAVTFEPNRDGTFKANAQIVKDNAGAAVSIQNEDKASIFRPPESLVNEQLTIANFIYQEDKINIKIGTLTVDAVNEETVEIPEHEDMRILSGFEDMYIYITDQFAVFHPIAEGFASFEELFFEFYKDEMYLLGTKFIDPDLAPYWHSTIFKEVSGEMVVFSDYYFPIDTWGEDYKVIVTSDEIGSIDIALNNEDAPWSDLASGYFEVAGQPGECIAGCADCADGDTCSGKCASGYVKDGSNICQKCTGNCKSCTAGSPTTLGQCESCFKGFLHDSSAKTCTACAEGCIECGPDVNTCTRCPPGETVSSGSCVACPDDCLKCNFVNGVNTCSSCRAGTALHNGVCRECLASCSECDGTDIATCYNCVKGYLFVQGACVQCPANCQTCSSADTCTTCWPGYKNVNGVCYPNCKPPCKDCVNGQPETCASACWSGYTFDAATSSCLPDLSCNTGSTCSSCPVGYSLTGTAGSGDCDECTAGANCRNCEDGDTSVCEQAKFGFYLDDSDVPTACPTECASCDNEEVCTSCVDGYFREEGECLACESPCTTCRKSADLCMSCETDYVLVGWKCIFSQYVEYTLTLDTTMIAFIEQYEAVKAALAAFTDKRGKTSVTFLNLTEGSVHVSGQTESTDPGAAQTNMQAAMSTGGSLAGFSILESSITSTNPPATDEGPNLALILGLSITLPILLIIGIVIGVVIYKKRQAANAKIGAEEINENSMMEKENPNNMSDAYSPMKANSNDNVNIVEL